MWMRYQSSDHMTKLADVFFVYTATAPDHLNPLIHPAF